MRRGVSFLISVAILGVAAYLSWKLAFSDPPARPVPDDAGGTAGLAVTPKTATRPAAPPIAPQQPPPVSRVAPPPPPDAIEGVVTDAALAPVADVEVQVVHFEYLRGSARPPDRRWEERVLLTTVTDRDGRYRLAPLVPGELKNLRVLRAGFVTQFKDSVRVPGVQDFRLLAGVAVFGRVLDAATGAPIEGVGVKGFQAQGAEGERRGFVWKEEVLSKSDGTFAFEGAPPGDVNLRLFHPDYMDVALDRAVVPGARNEFAIRMTKGFVIEGVVRSKGTPVPKAEVAAKETIIAPRWQATTDDHGVFRMRGVRPGTILFEVSGRRLSPLREAVVIGPEHDVSGGAGRRLEFAVEGAGGAAGRVTSHKGEPIAGARVFVAPVQTIFVVVRDPAAYGGSAAEGETRTDADGRYLVGDLAAGQHRIVVAAQGYALLASNPIVAGPDRIVDGVDFVLGPAPAITGSITDENRMPVSDAVVTVAMPQYTDAYFPPGLDLGQKGERTAITDAAGRYRIEVPYAGKHQLSVDHRDFVLVLGVDVEVGIEAEVPRDFTLRRAHAIAGSVFGPDGAQVEGAVVSAWGPEGSELAAKARSDANGAYVLSRLPSGLYRVHARKDTDSLTSEFRDEIAPPARGLDFRLTAGGEVVGTITDGSGAPVTKFQLALRPAVDREIGGRGGRKPSLAGLSERAEEGSDPGGIFRIERVDPGRWSLQISADGLMPSVPVLVDVKGGAAVSAGTIVLRAGGAVTGRIVGPSGDPADGVSVNLTRVGESPLAPDVQGALRTVSIRTDGRGEYAARGLVPGDYLMRIDSERFVDPPQERFSVPDGTIVDKSFALAVAASITLEVRDEVSAPTAAVIVNVMDARQRKIQAVTEGVGGQTTDRQGRIKLKKLPAGEPLTFKLIRAGYLVVDVVKTLAEGDNGTAAVTIQRNHGQ